MTFLHIFVKMYWEVWNVTYKTVEDRTVPRTILRHGSMRLKISPAGVVLGGLERHS